MLFFHRASVEEAERFFAARAPDAHAIADTDGSLFAAFDLQRGSLIQLLGPAVWWRGLVALFKGNFVGKPTGNETQMPGAFLVEGQKVLWKHRAKHAGDHPELHAVLQALDPNHQPTPQTTSKSAPRPKSGKLKKMNQQHLKLLTEARDLQRSGDIQGFAAKTAEAEALAQEIDALESAGQ